MKKLFAFVSVDLIKGLRIEGPYVGLTERTLPDPEDKPGCTHEMLAMELPQPSLAVVMICREGSPVPVAAALVSSDVLEVDVAAIQQVAEDTRAVNGDLNTEEFLYHLGEHGVCVLPVQTVTIK